MKINELRGNVDKGVTATQGFYPSTIWGENILKILNKYPPTKAANKIIQRDKNKNYRQISCLNLKGQGFCFTGNKNIKYSDQIVLPNLVVCGNMLGNRNVVKKIVENFKFKNENLHLFLNFKNVHSFLFGVFVSNSMIVILVFDF